MKYRINITGRHVKALYNGTTLHINENIACSKHEIGIGEWMIQHNTVLDKGKIQDECDCTSLVLMETSLAQRKGSSSVDEGTTVDESMTMYEGTTLGDDMTLLNGSWTTG